MMGTAAAVGVPPRLEFAALCTHRGRRRALGIGVYLLAFDVLAADGQDLPYRRRRVALENVLGRPSASRVQLVPSTTDRAHTRAWLDASLGEVGIEGVVAKPLGRPYRSGRDSGWIKIQHLVTAAAVIGGVIGTRQHPPSLVLVAREPSAGGRWLPTGVTGPIAASLREELASSLVFASMLGRERLKEQYCECPSAWAGGCRARRWGTRAELRQAIVVWIETRLPSPPPTTQPRSPHPDRIRNPLHRRMAPRPPCQPNSRQSICLAPAGTRVSHGEVEVVLSWNELGGGLVV